MRGGRRRVGGGRDLGREVVQGAGGFGFEPGEFCGDAGLDVQFEVFGSGAVRLYCWKRGEESAIGAFIGSFLGVLLDVGGGKVFVPLDWLVMSRSALERSGLGFRWGGKTCGQLCWVVFAPGRCGEFGERT